MASLVKKCLEERVSRLKMLKQGVSDVESERIEYSAENRKVLIDEILNRMKRIRDAKGSTNLS